MFIYKVDPCWFSYTNSAKQTKGFLFFPLTPKKDLPTSGAEPARLMLLGFFSLEF